MRATGLTGHGICFLTLLLGDDTLAMDHVGTGNDDDRHANQSQIIWPFVKYDKAEYYSPDQSGVAEWRYKADVTNAHGHDAEQIGRNNHAGSRQQYQPACW